MAMRTKLGRWLRAERRKRGLTVVEMAKLIGKVHSRVSAYENGADVPADVMTAYGHAFKIPVELMLEMIHDERDPDEERILQAYRRLPEMLRPLLVQYVVGWVDCYSATHAGG